VAPRDTYKGVGVGRKAGCEAGEAVRWGHFFSKAMCGQDRCSADTRASLESISELDRWHGTRGRESRLPLHLLNSELTEKYHFDPYADPYGRHRHGPSPDPEELRDVISRAEALTGDEIDDLVKRYQLGATSKTPPRYQHRLIELLLRMRKAGDNPDDALAESTAALAAAEVSGILQTFEDWQSDPAWPEFQQAVQGPRTYLHAVTTTALLIAVSR
jgi:hypothetical protein